MKREYLIEAAAIGTFMISAALITSVVEHPASPVRQAVQSPMGRRLITGCAMALTAIGLIYSPLGKRSGAHMNPAVTLTFWRLGKVNSTIARQYVLAQFVGACIGLGIAALVGSMWLRDPAVAYVATRPGAYGMLPAFAGELVISFGVMLVVLSASNSRRLAPYTGLLVGGLITTYITFEAPLSGMSMNPARTLAPLIVGGVPTSLWIYFTAPPIGMLAASELYLRLHGRAAVRCAKLQHPANGPCPFSCTWPQAAARETAPLVAASKRTNADGSRRTARSW